VGALSSVGAELDRIALARRGPSTISPQFSKALSDLKAREDKLLNVAATNARSVLSSDGLALFDDYVEERVKRQITVYGAPPAQ
jgi:hypothetical protein